MEKSIFVFGIFLVLVSCAPLETHEANSQASTVSYLNMPNVLEIDGNKYTKYTKWTCRDYVHDERIALEVVKTDKGVVDVMGGNIHGAIEEVQKENNNEITKEQEGRLKVLLEGVVQEAFSKYSLGYVLYDGSKEYARTFYLREGISHRWEWEDGKYVFIIKPNGLGLYYDFTNTEKGAPTKAHDIFKCEKV